MGLLDKINPRATASSVIHQALVGGISGAVVWAVVIRREVPRSRVLDSDLDADALWPIFQRAISDALGVEPEEVTKEKGLHDLGATWFL